MRANQSSRFPQWSWWIMGAVTFLSLTILVLSVVLGVRAGQTQLELTRRQQVGMLLQSALDYRSEGNLRGALDEYQKVLLIDPGNPAAVTGIENLFQTASANAGSVITATALLTQTAPASSTLAPTTTTPSTLTTASPPLSAPTPISTTVSSEVMGLWSRAQASYKAGRWTEALELLQSVQRSDARFEVQAVNDLLFESYINLAAEKDNSDNLEEALTLYDRALELRPDAAEIRTERSLIDSYIQVLTYYGADWPATITLLTNIYAIDPNYRDASRRLGNALLAYADNLAAQELWCDAAQQYDAATAITTTQKLLEKRSQVQALCDSGGVAIANLTPTTTGVATPSGVATRSVTTATTPVATPSATPTAAPAPIAVRPGSGLTFGNILYSARDPIDGRTRIFAQAVTGSAPIIVQEDASQPSLRGDGLRMVFRNLRNDMRGLSAFDPDTQLMFRITEFAEDVQPSWNAQGSRVVFASNREGDRRWRIYTVWAEERGAVTTLTFGESPAWSPVGDTIVVRGCDQSGNNCGLWAMDGAGGSRNALTTVQADNRPSWAPDGRTVVFQSDGRDGNTEIYRVDLASGQVTRLTDSAAMDILPTVSPDGAWVAFASNRENAWKIWVVPLAGGEAELVAPIKGDLGDWTGQTLQWVP